MHSVHFPVFQYSIPKPSYKIFLILQNQILNRIKYMYILYLITYSIFLDIARTLALSKNFVSNVPGNLGRSTYHETFLHNLDDVADLGADSKGTNSDKMHELEEILEDESQSPDEQVAYKYAENSKVFDNPVVLEVTSKPTVDEVKEFEKVKAHELASEDKHFDSLSSLVSQPGNLKVTGTSFTVGFIPLNNLQTSLGNKNLGGNGLNVNHLVSGLSGLNFGHTEQNGLLNDAVKHGILEPQDLPPVNVNAQAHNHFHVLNVNHHLSPIGDLNFNFQSPNTNPSTNTGKECFERTSKDGSKTTECYCSRQGDCRCTKSFVMVASFCDTMINDNFFNDFCTYDVKSDLQNNQWSSKKSSETIYDAFLSLKNGLCNNVTLDYCRYTRKQHIF
uniref:Uncharacterized protein n=1 Tax=Theileria annulata TaxID=5874 RepID=A0A3B0MVN7_THEAN